MDRPILSVVIAGSRAMGPVDKFLDQIKLNQHKVEYILVTANQNLNVSPFENAGAKVLIEAEGTMVPHLRAVGFKYATSELVAMTEDFCLPSDNWVESIINAHKKNHAIAIGGPVKRQSGTAGEWALSFCEYARFMPSNNLNVKDLPAVNISFKRAKVTEIYGGVPDEIEEFTMLPFLVDHGASLVWDERIYIYDVNDQPMRRSLPSFFFHGRYFGGMRVKGSGFTTKLIRAFLSPCIPFMQVLRVGKHALSAGYLKYFLRSFVFIFLLSTYWALGEGIGSIMGEGNSKKHWV
jgi:hypothetical protein